MPTRKSARKAAKKAVTKPAAEAPKRVPPPSTSLPLAVQVVQMEAHLDSIKTVSDVSLSAIQRMKLLLTPERVAEKMEKLMSATRWVGFGENLKEVPDYVTQLAAMRMFLGYTEGLPIQRIEQISTNVESEAQTMARLEKSPASRRHMRAALDAMDAQDSDGAVKAG